MFYHEIKSMYFIADYVLGNIKPSVKMYLFWVHYIGAKMN
jgi:hypothetical protein